MGIFLQLFERLQLIRKRLRSSDVVPVVTVTTLLILIGAVGFSRLEGWTLLEAVYVAVITMTTVGYGDLSPVTPAGRGFALGFAFVAIGVAGYAISTFAANLIEGRAAKRAKTLRKRRMKRIDELDQHFILCGADLVGTRIAEEFQLAGADYILVEPDEERLKQALLYSHPDYFQRKLRSFVDVTTVDLSEYEGLSVAQIAELLDTPFLLEDPTDDAVLVQAGIARAQGLIAALPDGRDNLSVVIGARALAQRESNSELRIMARSEGGGNMRKLYLAGADFVRVPAIMTGLEMATHMLHPEVGNWWYSLVGLDRQAKARFQQVALADRPHWIGLRISQLHEDFGVLTLAVKRGESFTTPPPADLILAGDDIAIILPSGPAV